MDTAPGSGRRGPTVAAWGVRQLFRTIRPRGVDVAAIRRRAGLEGVDLDDPDTRVLDAAGREAWRAALELTGDDTLGLRAAETLSPGAFDLLEYAFRAGRTLGGGFRQVVRHARLLHDLAAARLEAEGEGVRLVFGIASQRPFERHRAEFYVAAWLKLAREASSSDLDPLEVRFVHEAPGELDARRRFFRAPLQFASPATALLFSASQMELPLVDAAAALETLLQRRIGALPRPAPIDDSVASRVRQVLIGGLASGDASLARVADDIGLSVRTLNRKLADEGTSFRSLLESVRREQATTYLRDRHTPIAEVAFLLGYSESSAFHRSFKRWTGVTPLSYRLEAAG